MVAFFAFSFVSEENCEFFLNFFTNLKKKNRIGRRCINGPCHANNVVKHSGAPPY